MQLAPWLGIVLRQQNSKTLERLKLHPVLPYLVIGALALGGLLVGINLWIIRAYDMDFSRFFTPASVAEAAEHGVLVQEVAVGQTRDLSLSSTRLMSEAWVHAESHAEWRWLLFRRVVLDSGRFLCFTLEGNSPDPISEVAYTRFEWRDETGTVFSPSQTSGSPVVWCREAPSEIPEVLNITRVDTRAGTN